MIPDIQIIEIARRFRSAIERTEIAKLAYGMSEFPSGSCGDASMLLGKHLNDLGFENFLYAFGVRGRMDDDTYGTHAWIADGDLVVDITADQFPDVSAPVIVSRNSDWHKQFRVELKPIHLEKLGATYQNIMVTLNAG